MPSGSYKQVYVQCPFYREDDGRFSITCEGFGDARYLKQRYRNMADYEKQITIFCCQHYKKCEVYRLLMEKYDEEEDEMSMDDDVIEVKVPAADSQYRLCNCKKCSGDNVAYVRYNGRGGAAWRVECFDCGHRVDKGCHVRHDAQAAWNKGDGNGLPESL